MEADWSRIDVMGLEVDRVTENDVVQRVVRDWSSGVGGVIVTPNVDIWRRARREVECADVVSSADIAVADGQPLVWASRICRDPLPERVAGSSLVESLSAAAAAHDIPVYIIGGGAPGVAALAAEALSARHLGLRVVGHVVPPLGFETSTEVLERLVADVVAADPGLVLVGLGFPKQEHFATVLRSRLPRAWFLGCGAGVAMAAGDRRRPPAWVQRAGLEWLARLAQEPTRLARRYLVDDAPAAVVLLSGSLARRWGR